MLEYKYMLQIFIIYYMAKIARSDWFFSGLDFP